LCIAIEYCLILFEQDIRRDASRAAWTAGRRIAINIPMIAITTTSSTRVKAKKLFCFA
jgi:hypothetical protein